jgi:hypothetical protein
MASSFALLLNLQALNPTQRATVIYARWRRAYDLLCERAEMRFSLVSVMPHHRFVERIPSKSSTAKSRFVNNGNRFILLELLDKCGPFSGRPSHIVLVVVSQRELLYFNPTNLGDNIYLPFGVQRLLGEKPRTGGTILTDVFCGIADLSNDQLSKVFEHYLCLEACLKAALAMIEDLSTIGPLVRDGAIDFPSWLARKVQDLSPPVDLSISRDALVLIPVVCEKRAGVKGPGIIAGRYAPKVVPKDKTLYVDLKTVKRSAS